VVQKANYGGTTMLLNDIQADKRLAYMLGPTLDRYHRRERSLRAVRLAVLGVSALLLLFLWKMLQWP
jgi:hypothetical protein